MLAPNHEDKRYSQQLPERISPPAENSSIIRALASAAFQKITNAKGADELMQTYMEMLASASQLTEARGQFTADFEIEVEQKIFVHVSEPDAYDWVTHIADVYDKTRRIRIRVKNGVPRYGTKIPLLPDMESDLTKRCIRLEQKPQDDEAKMILFAFLFQLMNIPGSKLTRKRGAQITLKDGRPAWLNQCRKTGHCWVEVDGNDDIVDLLPDGIQYLQHSKNGVGIYGNELYDRDSFTQTMQANFQATSRSASGIFDTSVSKEKNSLFTAKELEEDTINKNIEIALQYIWSTKDAPLESSAHVYGILMDIIMLVNGHLGEDATAYRSWEVTYGKKLPPGEVAAAVDIFCEELYQKLLSIEKGMTDPIDVAAWIEFEFDSNIHPLADGCGRVAKALSAYVLARFDHVLPMHKNRNEYYAAMNQGYTVFRKYYLESIQLGAFSMIGLDDE